MNRNLAAGLSFAAVAAAAVAAAALILPRSAFAGGEATIESEPFVGTLTRAQVREALKAPFDFRRDTDWGEQQTGAPPLKSSWSRREAVDDYRRGREQANALTGEDSGSRYLSLESARRSAATTMGGPPRP